jgi:hypothetical protein
MRDGRFETSFVPVNCDASAFSLYLLKDLLKNLQENFIRSLDSFHMFFILGRHALILLSQRSQL